jgi:hypothetical protein
MKTGNTHKTWLDATDDGSAVEELLSAIESIPNGTADVWSISKIPTYLNEHGLSSVTTCIKSLEGNFKVVMTRLCDGDGVLEQTVRYFGITPNQMRTVIKTVQESNRKSEKAFEADTVAAVERLILSRQDGVILQDKPNGWHLSCGNNTLAYHAKSRTVSIVWGSIDNFLHMVKNK